MRRPIIRKKIIRILKQGPATALEVSAELRVRSRLASAHMSNGYKAGAFVRSKFSLPCDGRTGRRSVWMYSLKESA